MENSNFYIHAPIIEECINGSSKAQYRLYNLYSKAMFNLAYRMMNNREDAEDILQEAFVECFRNIASFRFESTFGAWLKKITVNKCINQINKKKIDLMLCETLPNTVYEEEDEPAYDTVKIFKGIGMLPDHHLLKILRYPIGLEALDESLGAFFPSAKYMVLGRMARLLAMHSVAIKVQPGEQINSDLNTIHHAKWGYAHG